MELFDALVQNDGRCILDAARDGDRGGNTEPHDHDREGDLGDDHEGGHLVALHALGRLAEDGLERDAGKGEVHAGEADGHEHDHPDGTGLNAGHEGEELGDEQGERREGGEREQGDDGERCRDGSDLDDALDLVQVAGVVDVLDVTGHAEGERLREAVEDAVQQAGGDTERATDTQAQRDHADVVDGGVREAALDIVLLKDAQGGHQDGQRAQDEQERTRIGVAHRDDGQGVEADDHQHGALEQHAREQRGDRARSLGVRVGQPSVHGEQARLGAKADHDEREREAHEHRVELVGVGHDGGEEGGLMRVGHDIGGVRVDEQRAEQAEGHTGGADHRVLPRRLERLLVLVDAHEEHGRQRSGLDRRPGEDDVVGQAGEQHRENEQAKQRVVLLGALGRHGLLLDIDLDIGDGVHAGDEPDDAYQKDEDRRERIEMEPQAQSVDILPAREHGSRGDDRKDKGRRDGDGVEPREDVVGRRLGERSHNQREHERTSEQGDRQH